MPASWLGSDTSVYYADLIDAITGAQEEEQGRYQAGLQPYRESAEYYEPGGEFAQQQPSYLYSSFIQPFVGGSGGALRNLFSTTKAGQISMRAAQQAELQRGQMYSQAQQALGEATQRYPMMPEFGSIPSAIANEYATNERQLSSSGYRSPTNAPASTQEPGGGGGGGSGSTATSSAVSDGGSTGTLQSNEGLWINNITGQYAWGDYSGPNSYWAYVGSWDRLQEMMQQNPNLNVSDMPETYVDPNTGQVSYR